MAPLRTAAAAAALTLLLGAAPCSAFQFNSRNGPSWSRGRMGGPRQPVESLAAITKPLAPRTTGVRLSAAPGGLPDASGATPAAGATTTVFATAASTAASSATTATTDASALTADVDVDAVLAEATEPEPEPAPAPKIIIAGAPASGKGTQCEMIKEKFGVVHLSTGDILRAAVKEGTELGKTAGGFMDRGELVPDEVMIGVVGERLKQEDCECQGWLLDGFPRTGAQAAALVDSGALPDVFLLLDVPDEDLVDRVVGRYAGHL